MVATRTNEPPKSRGRDRRDHAPEISGDGGVGSRSRVTAPRSTAARARPTLSGGTYVYLCVNPCVMICAQAVCAHMYEPSSSTVPGLRGKA